MTLAEELQASRLIREGSRIAEKLRLLAARIDVDVERMRIPSSQNPTPKRNREHASKMIEADHLERASLALTALATLHEKGDCPPFLAKLTTKTAVLPLLRTDVDTSGGYYSIIDTRKWSDTSPAAAALQALLSTPDTAVITRREIERRERDLVITNIPGFFQTPTNVVRRMIAFAQIEADHACLEPSAGNGNIADEMPGCDCIERNQTLREILELKGHKLVGHDLLDHSGAYDRIVMNPPFENGADMAHVRHAFNLLKPGGRLVAILSPSYEFHQKRAAQEFREWIEDKLEHAEELPSGTFTGPETVTQTQVSARLVVLTT